MEAQEIALRLNIAYKLYSKMKDSGKPYKVHKAKEAYLTLLNRAKEQFEFHRLDTIENLESLFGKQPRITEITESKTLAIAAGSYEEAAQLRDMERKRIEQLLIANGVNEDDYFYCFGGKIYFKR